MNNRTEAKLTDLSGMQKAIEEILKQAWERGRKYGQNEERPTGEWVTFPTSRLIMQCPECTAFLSRTRSDIFKDSIGEMNYCPNCGTGMRKSQTQKFADNDTAYGGLASAT